MVFCNNGEISSSSVFILHCWSLVKYALTTSPLLSVMIVEYSTLSGRGNIQFRMKNKRIRPRMVIPVHLRKRSIKDATAFRCGCKDATVFRRGCKDATVFRCGCKDATVFHRGILILLKNPLNILAI